MPSTENTESTEESTVVAEAAAESGTEADAAEAPQASKDGASPASVDSEASEEDARLAEAPKSVDRRALAIAGALLAACAGLVLYGVLDADEKPEHRVPTASVTYEVTGEGTVDIAYQARSESGEATVAGGVELPWKKTVQVPLGKAPVVSITLGEKGGQASCALAVRGKHVQTATAFGRFGRATCQGELPAPEPSEPAATVQQEG